MSPVIHCYCVTWNEEVILPYFLRHYSSFCQKIIIYDQYSTDKTHDILKSFTHSTCEVIVRLWGENEKFNDFNNLAIKQNAYKESRGKADWVIISDCDEFLYHPILQEKLLYYKNIGINLPKVKGYNMMPDCEIDSMINLPDVYNIGEPYHMYDKPMIFDPALELKFSAGCHWLEYASENTKTSCDNEFLFLLHYRKLNLKYWIERSQQLGKRLSDINLRANMGTHNLRNTDELIKDYNESLKNVVKVY